MSITWYFYTVISTKHLYVLFLLFVAVFYGGTGGGRGKARQRYFTHFEQC